MRWGRRLLAALLVLTGVVLLLASNGITVWTGVPATVRTAALAQETSRSAEPTGTPSAAKGHALQAQGRPVSVQLPAVGYSSDSPAMEIASSGVIRPPDFSRLFWISDRGVPPSAAAQDTTYFACHTNSKKSIDEVPCNRLSGNVEPGDVLTVNLDKGSVVYRVTSARQVRRSSFAADPAVWGVHPGRLIWVSCYIEDGRRTDFNYVITAEAES